MENVEVSVMGEVIDYATEEEKKKEIWNIFVSHDDVEVIHDVSTHIHRTPSSPASYQWACHNWVIFLQEKYPKMARSWGCEPLIDLQGIHREGKGEHPTLGGNKERGMVGSFGAFLF
jgi:hypothetical protein